MINVLVDRELNAAGINGAALRASYARCRAINAAHGKTYFLATLLLPPAKRPPVHALYGFARYVDDLVDDFVDDGVDPTDTLAGLQRAERVLDWTAEFFADLEWGETSDPVGRAVLDTIRRWSLRTSYFIDFVDSMVSDLTVTSYATFADLEKYMWGSAAVIGLQMLPILGRASEDVRWDTLESHAISLGIAFQLTNFLRDIAEDLRRGRVYLPQESLDRFGVDRERLARGVVDEPIRNLLAWEIERARRYYADAAPGIELVHPTSQDCLRTAWNLYAQILAEIERNDYDVFSRRVRVGQAQRAVAGLTGARRALAARRGARHAAPTTPTG